MFTLKFFILFVLAGLCFGDASASGTGSNTQVNGASDGQEKEKEEVGSPGGATEPKNGPGEGLPDFIGDEEKKKKYVNTLVTNCGNLGDWKVNEKHINASLPRCTYICEGIKQTRQVAKKMRKRIT
uniref:Putative secreted protein n=1 Tax=Ixodes ricinus TaxID=34613 RepID=V5ICD1_IXORI